MQKGQWANIQCSNEYPEGPLLLNEPGKQPGGGTYYNAQGIFRATLTPTGSGAARVRLVPEIHHGEIRPRIVSDNGSFRPDYAKPKKAYDKLVIDVTLKPGQTLIITSDPAL